MKKILLFTRLQLLITSTCRCALRIPRATTTQTTMKAMYETKHQGSRIGTPIYESISIYFMYHLIVGGCAF